MSKMQLIRQFLSMVCLTLCSVTLQFQGGPDSTILKSNYENFKNVFDVNVFGGFMCAKHAARVMIPAKKGSILFTSSVASVTYGDVPHTYLASKNAVVGLAKNLGVELGEHGIRVNCVSPFGVATPLFRNIMGVKEKEKIEEFVSEIAKLKGTNMEAEDVAEGALYLASDESKYISGMNLVIDGGYSTTNIALKQGIRRSVDEVLPPFLDSTSEPPSLFDGTIRLYTHYQCPFAQRVWITRNFKGLQDKIELVPIDLQNRPAWYKEIVYPPNKVPSLEHNNKVIGESLDLIKYVDSNFEGPSLLPDDPEKQKFAEELVVYSDTFVPEVNGSFKGDVGKQAGPQFDYLEKALQKFDDGPFFLGHEFSQVDIAYAPFVERFQIFLKEVFNYNITTGRPKLTKWIEEVDKIDGYKQTKVLDPKGLVEYYKSRFLQA